ncbi:unnamed protein product [Ixodes pacificus]
MKEQNTLLEQENRLRPHNLEAAPTTRRPRELESIQRGTQTTSPRMAEEAKPTYENSSE